MRRRSPHNLHRTLDEHFLSNVEVFFERCQVGQRAAFLLPAPKRGRNKATDMLSLPAAITADSGGRAEIHPALHAFWRFNLPATEAGNETVCRIGGALAIRFGGDPVFLQSRHAVRVSKGVN
jgi:hypothetical protein